MIILVESEILMRSFAVSPNFLEFLHAKSSEEPDSPIPQRLALSYPYIPSHRTNIETLLGIASSQLLI
jgi:hypothetical protein